jgi:diguanylate cyclase (GGDEF)-like protein/PAS domain S-box-containing protein
MALLDGLSQDSLQDAGSLKTVLSAMPVGVSWARLADMSLVFMNRKFTEIFGYRIDDFKDLFEWRDKVYPFEEDRELIQREWGSLTPSPDVVDRPLEVRIRCKDGSIKTVLHSRILLPEAGWVLATFVDISDRKRDETLLRAAQRQAAENEAVYRLLLDHSPEMILLSPFDESRRYVSPAVEQITGFTPEEFLAMPRLETVHSDEHGEAMRLIAEMRGGSPRQVFRYRILQKDGGYRWVEAIVTGYNDPVSGQPAGYVATVRDIAEQKRREELFASEFQQMSQVALMDEVTGIANRRTFNQAFEMEGRRHTRSVGDLSLMILDVDYFKRYNDIYGHLAGDACLNAVAHCLKDTMRRDADLCARFGGEEFVVLMPMTGMPGAEVVAELILDAIASLRIAHAGSPFGFVTVSIGIASWPAGVVLEPNLLIEQADRALYLAKNNGRNCFARG